MKRHRNSVNAIVSRYARLRKIDPDTCDGVAAALRRPAVEGDGLDPTECLIVEFKRDRLISDSKMIALLRRHQKEVTGRI